MQSHVARSAPVALTRYSTKIEWTLRVGAFLCFVGHGAFGVITKEAWLRYFAVVGIGRGMAYQLMPMIGAVDILLGILTLTRPRRALLLWMTLWAVWTAMLRPLAAEPVWEALERAGNYGVPFALLMLYDGSHGWSAWFSSAKPRPLTDQLALRLRVVLTITTALLLLGHGALAVLDKRELVLHYALLGFSTHVEALTQVIGIVEIAFAILVIWRPSVTFCLFLFGWKLATESLFLTAGAPLWEVVERGGSYAAPLALAVVLQCQQFNAFILDVLPEKAGRSKLE
jgi:hypothetical protein